MLCFVCYVCCCTTFFNIPFLFMNGNYQCFHSCNHHYVQSLGFIPFFTLLCHNSLQVLHVFNEIVAFLMGYLFSILMNESKGKLYCSLINIYLRNHHFIWLLFLSVPDYTRSFIVTITSKVINDHIC